MKLPDILTKLDEIKQLSASICDAEKSSADVFKGEISYLHSRIDSLRSYLDELWRTLWEHKEGHIPKLSSPSQLKKALEVLGLDGDYEVQKKTIYASNGIKQKTEFLISVK